MPPVQLHDFEHFAKRIELDPVSKKVLRQFVLPDDAGKRLRYSMDGVYLVIGDKLEAFFRNGARMNLLIGENLYEDLDLMTVQYGSRKKTSYLRVFLRGAPVHELVYTPIDYGISDPARRDGCFNLKSWSTH